MHPEFPTSFYFFTFIAVVLLVLVTFSAPTLKRISFLNVRYEGQEFHFGAFGFTGTGSTVGFNSERLNDLTAALILHPIAVSQLASTLIFGPCATSGDRY
ncbi:hypothetical protein M422DRAFT_255554 [Sphaerobolus stellatus SS14]|uniref:Uncharacterized protein n=1 Tax=Sphaerobolus stellatus (strain SS14) TaxID=990650 RepID=A0A0C9VIN0_SPHS4|nr:hypothetical protein M422DRAFT_255554 [Sphaerobolus stellatus SS14]